MIGPWLLSEVAQALGGELRGQDRSFASPSTDTRTLAPGALYIALRGERFDGHEFVADAQANGAVAALVDHPLEIAIPQIQVEIGRASCRERVSTEVVG